MPSYRSSRPRRPEGPTVAITIGDPFGVGPEVVLKALASPTLSAIQKSGTSRKLRGLGPPFLLKRAGLANFLVIGDLTALFAAAGGIKIPPYGEVRDLKIIAKNKIRFGRVSRLSGSASLAYIDEALKLIKSGRADCLVTAPVSKEAISKAGISFSGHTEYIAKAFAADDYAMMLTGGPLKVTLVTRHLPLKDVAAAITVAGILKCVKLSHEALKVYFGIKRPRIGVASLNPHGGEGGRIGDEEMKIIKPALEKARRVFKDVTGPASSEVLFYDAFRGRLDCIVAMYHDQGLTPLKMVGRDDSVNVTLGLPFARTSPGHGTAFDIAGKDMADPRPMIEAILLAIDMYNKSKRRPV